MTEYMLVYSLYGTTIFLFIGLYLYKLLINKDIKNKESARYIQVRNPKKARLKIKNTSRPEQKK